MIVDCRLYMWEMCLKKTWLLQWASKVLESGKEAGVAAGNPPSNKSSGKNTAHTHTIVAPEEEKNLHIAMTKYMDVLTNDVEEKKARSHAETRNLNAQADLHEATLRRSAKKEELEDLKDAMKDPDLPAEVRNSAAARYKELLGI